MFIWRNMKKNVLELSLLHLLIWNTAYGNDTQIVSVFFMFFFFHDNCR